MIEIYSLIYHLKRCPEEFLKSILTSTSGSVETDVLVRDIYRKIFGSFKVEDSSLPSVYDTSKLDENKLISIQIACWFFSYPYFRSKPKLLPLIHKFIFQDLLKVSKYVKHKEWVEEEDRVEEFIRLALKRCKILPSGETQDQFSDRLEALDTIKRRQVLLNSSESMERIKEIRRKMAEQKAREAASVYGRE